MSFNWKVYKYLNSDLKLSTPEEYEEHYLNNKKIKKNKDRRKSSVYDLYPDFNPIIYRKNYSDLDELIEKLNSIIFGN